MRLFFLRTSTPQPVEHGDQLVAGHRGLPAGRSVLIAGNESLLQGPGPGLRAPGGVGLPAAQLLQILPGQALKFLLCHVVLLLLERSGVHPPVIFYLTAEKDRISVHPLILGGGRVADPDQAVLPPDHHEVAGAGPQSPAHQSNEVIALPQQDGGLPVILMVRLSVGVDPAQLAAGDAKFGELGDEVAVIGPLVQGLVPVLHRPGAGVHRSEGLSCECLNEHGRRRGPAAGTADGGALPGDPVGERCPAGVGLEIGDRAAVHGFSPLRRWFCVPK